MGIPRISGYRFTQSSRNPETTDHERTMAEARNVTSIIKCVVKGYHDCHVSVEDGEAFVALRKRGQRENAFIVVNQCGQLSHLEAELVSPLWLFNAEIDVLTLPLFSITLFLLHDRHDINDVLIAFKSH